MDVPPDRVVTFSQMCFSMDNSRKLNLTSSGPKYLTITRENSEQTLVNVSPSLIKKVIDNVCGGEVEMCKKLRNGTIMVKTKNLQQAKKLISLKSFVPTIQVKVSEHTFLNYTKGVIYSTDLIGVPENMILEDFKEQNVTEIKKILKNSANGLIETGLTILTFASPILPSQINHGYEKLNVRPYFPLPLRCKNCFRYGHTAKICRNKKTCINCSNDFHSENEQEICTSEKSCINCQENNKENINHSPTDKSCPIFLKEKEIQIILTKEKVPRKKAIQIFNERNQTNNPSFASVVKHPETTTAHVENFLSNLNNNAMPTNISNILNNDRSPVDYSDLSNNIAKKDNDTTTKQKLTQIQIMPWKISNRNKLAIKRANNTSKQSIKRSNNKERSNSKESLNSMSE